jgi:membrane-bound serine protease (ClpP class)
MWKNVAVTLLVVWITYEVIEHIVFPLIWSAFMRKRKPLTGAAAMIGREAVVKTWSGNEGRVSIRGELWRAVSAVPLSPGDRVIIVEVEKLTLKVKPLPRALPPEALSS